MASWRNSCSSARLPRATRPSLPEGPATVVAPGTPLALALLLSVAACGRADIATTTNGPAAAATAATAANGATAAEAPAGLDAATALCPTAEEGYLRARLQGAIVADVDWASPATPQCLGGPRPGAVGLRLVYKGDAGQDRLLVIVGVALVRGTTSARNVPASVTVVREGAGEFFATQGDEKCALDEARVEPVEGHAGRYRLSGRGYCTQPARAVNGGAGAVLVTRFDLGALVEYPEER